ncbi:MAG TPA: alpha/beta fold hydrolase [Blastocatellia bacterium]|nr:alpha/beta fold hydrolase [Blastocatellia bacterium]
MNSILEEISQQWAQRPFIPPPGLRNGHVMTIVGSLRHRDFPALRQTRCEKREFQTEPETRVVAYCHWQPDRRSRPTVIVIHGLEGEADAKYVLGTADKAWTAGFNVLRYNVRNCGGTAPLTPTLYHSGLTVDLHYLIRELIEHDGLPELFLIGFSMGGNQALKLAGELEAGAPRQLRGVCAISPPIDLESGARALARRENWIYEIRFVISLKETIRRKDRLFPGVYDVDRLRGIRHLWDWDEAYQPYNGFRDARDYYARASSISFIPLIRVPTLIIHAEDDPFIPYEPFTDRRVTGNPSVFLSGSKYGGHVAFCGRRRPGEDRAWAENRAVEFCRRLSSI